MDIGNVNLHRYEFQYRRLQTSDKEQVGEVEKAPCQSIVPEEKRMILSKG